MRSVSQCFKQHILKIIVACAALFMALFVLPLTANAIYVNPDGAQVVRVGYVENAGMIQTPMVNGSEGYGYTYLEKILEYTEGDYTLEFVSCTRDEIDNLLLSGEIDLYGLVSYDAALEAQGVLYTDMDFANNILFLASMQDITIDTSNYTKLEGATIGTIVNSIYVDAFLDEYGISATVIELSEVDYEQAFEWYNLDFCVVSSLAYPDSDAINILAQIDSVPMYCVASPDNQDLIDDINQAMVQIEKKEYHFEESTYLKYYDYDIEIDTFISSEEYLLLQSQEVYRVGVRNLNAPFSKKDSEGNWSGVVTTLLEMIADYAGITIEVVEIYDDTTAETLAALDLDFTLFANEVEDDSTESTSYLSMPLVLIDHSETIGTADTVGVLSYYGISSIHESGNILERSATSYDSIDAIIAAFNNGEIESMILTTTSLNYMRVDIEDDNFLSTMLDTEVNLVLYYAADLEQEKIDVFEKIILNLDEATLEYALLENATKIVDFTLRGYLEQNPVVMLWIIIFILLLIGIMDERRRRAILKRANVDALTGLASKQRFDKDVRKRLNNRINLQGLSRKYQIVSVDIDNFKYINEIYGYETGTKVLKKVSDIIKADLSSDTLMTRAYADNFLILTNANKNQDEYKDNFASSEALNADLSRILGTSYRFSFSVGVYDVPPVKVPVNYMFDCANVARELGKGTVGTTIHKFSEEINIERAKNNEIAANMDQALADGEFILHYQPKVELSTDRLVGAEALVRWNRKGKMVVPFHFIPLFEKNGFIQQLDLEVLTIACKFLEEHADIKIPKISVNLSGITVAKDNVVEDIMAIIEAHHIHPSQIDIEITESAFVGNSIAQETVSKLERRGISISMDDFGVGISSLSRLKSLEIDTLKIDRAFIVDYLANEKGAVILKSILSMARTLGIETVAEGIETKEQMESLLRYGCDVGQGYFFSRAVDESEFLQMCERDAAKGSVVKEVEAHEVTASKEAAQEPEVQVEAPQAAQEPEVQVANATAERKAEQAQNV